MSIILNILFFLLAIILFLLILIIYILVSKRSFFIEYTKLEGLIIKIRILFFNVNIYKSIKPQKPEKKIEDISLKKQDIKENTKKENTEPKKEKTQTQTKKQEENKKEKTNIKDELFKGLSFSEIFSIIKDAVKSLNGFISVLAKKIKFEKISFTLPLHQENPLKTQKMYANVTNAFYLLSTQLQSKFYISYENPVFVADFENLLKDREYFYIKITARTGFLLAVLLYLYKQYVYYKKTYLTQKNKDKQDLKGTVD